ncbi:Uncharacterised protein [Enterobacter hormaechei]|nr:Uncharacterised protein [Enterobacter hormaechei]SAE92409.1 Uncharacterised protein [Enterobacter hormaechei]SAH46347.1 Uncharacterised protein [Enterobacter hormaechei]STP66785.1 Uncharacterised protein [Enterobacter hormaechei]STQ04913.1 Uncharacterised protein [Enterobacter hormaechei]
MEYRERREPLGLSDLLLVYHDFLLMTCSPLISTPRC